MCVIVMGEEKLTDNFRELLEKTLVPFVTLKDITPVGNLTDR